jgi:hypothetical protein
MQASALRRIWSTLLDYRDWVSYVYVPILIPILVLLPYFVFKSYQRSHRQSQLVDSLSQGSRDLELMSRLLEGPIKPWTGETPDEVRTLEAPDYKGFEILQDSRILDLRKWDSGATGRSDADSLVYGYRRLKLVKKPENVDNNRFLFRLLMTSPTVQVRFPPQQLRPSLSMSRVDSSVPGQKECHWGASYDFQKVPAGEPVDLVVEYFSPGQFLQQGENSTSFHFDTEAETAELTRWTLMPEGKEYRSFRIIRYETGKPEKVEAVRVTTEYLADDYTILAFKLLALKPGYTYEVSWVYK